MTAILPTKIHVAKFLEVESIVRNLVNETAILKEKSAHQDKIIKDLVISAENSVSKSILIAVLHGKRIVNLRKVFGITTSNQKAEETSHRKMHNISTQLSEPNHSEPTKSKVFFTECLESDASDITAFDDEEIEAFITRNIQTLSKHLEKFFILRFISISQMKRCHH
jgi:hypothetical protein